MSLYKAKTQIDHAFTRSNLKGLNFENAFAGANSFTRRKYTKDLTDVESVSYTHLRAHET